MSVGGKHATPLARKPAKVEHASCDTRSRCVVATARLLFHLPFCLRHSWPHAAPLLPQAHRTGALAHFARHSLLCSLQQGRRHKTWRSVARPMARCTAMLATLLAAPKQGTAFLTKVHHATVKRHVSRQKCKQATRHVAVPLVCRARPVPLLVCSHATLVGRTCRSWCTLV